MSAGEPVPPLSQWRALPEPHRGLDAVVVVPARNEEARIGPALRALAAQRGLDGAPLLHRRYEVLVLVNNSEDGTAAAVARVAREHPTLALRAIDATLEPTQANIGFVRRQLMDEALRRLSRADASPRAVIASTDGDSRVAPDWLAAQLAEVAAGADVVGGRIVGDPGDAPHARDRAVLRAQRRDLAHALMRSRLESVWLPDEADPWPRHHQHFGASLAVTVRAYVDVGGVPLVPFLEDEALAAALRRHDWRMRHSLRVRVSTSSRLDGRAEVGYAWQLRQWADRTSDFHDPLVERAGSWIAGLAALAELRRRRAAGERGDLALDARLQVPCGLSESLLGAGGPFGAMREAVARERQVAVSAASGAMLPLSASLADLRIATRALRSRLEGTLSLETRVRARTLIDARRLSVVT